MPAGNDGENARRELIGLDRQYGEFATAEDMILAHDRSFDKELRSALEKPVDADATLALGEVKPKYGGVVQSAAVRGGRLVVVEMVGEGDKGRPVKWHEPHKGSSVVQQAEARAAAGVGGGSADTGQVPGGTGADGQGDEAEKAPEQVKAEAMRDKLNDLRISVPADARKKDDLWALLPAEARTQLLSDAESA